MTAQSKNGEFRNGRGINQKAERLAVNKNFASAVKLRLICFIVSLRICRGFRRKINYSCCVNRSKNMCNVRRKSLQQVAFRKNFTQHIKRPRHHDKSFGVIHDFSYLLYRRNPRPVRLYKPQQLRRGHAARVSELIQQNFRSLKPRAVFDRRTSFVRASSVGFALAAKAYNKSVSAKISLNM